MGKKISIVDEDQLVIPHVTAEDRFNKKFSAAPYTIMKAVYADGNKIVLEAYENKCLLCDGTKDMYVVDDFQICKNCIKTLYEMMTEEENEVDDEE